MPNIGIFNGSPTSGAQDGTLVDTGNPIEDGDLTSGQDAVGTPIKLAIRLLDEDYTRSGSLDVDIVGGTDDKWALALDSGGTPGSFQSPGATLTLPGPITDLNTIFWARPLVTSDEIVAVETEDTSASFLIPDDVVTGGVGRSWDLPFANLGLAAVGRSWGLPYVNTGAITAVGRSWDLSYIVSASLFNDGFASSISGTNWLTKVSGSGSVSVVSGKAVVNKPAGTDTATLVGIGTGMDLAHGSATGGWKALFEIDRGGAVAQDWQYPVLQLARKTAAPSSGDTMSAADYFVLALELFYNPSGGGASPMRYRFKYVTSGGILLWNFVASAWQSTGFTLDHHPALPSQTDGTQYVGGIDLDATNGALLYLKSADESTTHGTSGRVAWASLGGSGNNYWPAVFGYQGQLTVAFSGQIKIDTISRF